MRFSCEICKEPVQDVGRADVVCPRCGATHGHDEGFMLSQRMGHPGD